MLSPAELQALRGHKATKALQALLAQKARRALPAHKARPDKTVRAFHCWAQLRRLGTCPLAQIMAISTSSLPPAMVMPGTVRCGPTLVPFRARKAHRVHKVTKVLPALRATRATRGRKVTLAPRARKGIRVHKATKVILDHKVTRVIPAPRAHKVIRGH